MTDSLSQGISQSCGCLRRETEDAKRVSDLIDMAAEGPRGNADEQEYFNLQHMDQETLKRLLRYDPKTGLFHWRVTMGKGRMRPGDLAGRVNKDGYVIITIAGRKYRAHRLAWLYVYGKAPAIDVDHRNGKTAENWIDNLREATDSQNSSNTRRHRDGASGYKGVSWHSQAQKWRASIQKEGRAIHLGLFETPEAAHAKYAQVAVEMFGEFARVS